MQSHTKQNHTNGPIYWLNQKFRDPISGGTHLMGAFASLIGTIYLLRAPTVSLTTLAFLVYGLSMTLLYFASALYHLPHVSEARRLFFRRLDHAMIPVFIAGTYTPFCVVALHNQRGDMVLGGVWILAAMGLFKAVVWVHSPRWVNAVIYVLMGWLSLLIFVPLANVLTEWSLVFLMIGGLSYSLGAVVYAIKRPDPWPNFFGFHEVWHLMVLGGSFFHFLAIATL